jgi:[acyl-carrier-protein] S-malonyltransferase
MLRELALEQTLVRQTFAEAADAIGVDLWKLAQEGPDAELNRTEHTQPAMLSAGVSVWRVWRQRGGALPGVMAGHSLGEYTALVCAGALDFAAAVRLVAERGRLMQRAVPEGAGAMAAVLGLEDARVREICAEAAGTQIVEAVNFNSPGQVVVAGDRAAVDRVLILAKAAGAKRVLPLPVSVPSHCALMRPAAAVLAERLAEVAVAMPSIPVLHNVTVAEAQSPEHIRQLLAQQLHSPVRWVETIQAMARRGVATVLEAGPGKVLSGLLKRSEPGLRGLPVFDPETLAQALREV